jgi:hypothetical protein
MPDEFDDPERSGNFDQPPAFFPYQEGPPEREPGSLGELVEVQVEGVYEAHNMNNVQRFVLLTDGDRRLPIIIGGFEATAISMPLESQRPDRPLTHDLIRNVLDRIGATVERIVIDDLWNTIYYAKVHIKTSKEEFEIDARPSDAIALAVRFDAPIFVADGILDAENEA